MTNLKILAIDYIMQVHQASGLLDDITPDILETYVSMNDEEILEAIIGTSYISIAILDSTKRKELIQTMRAKLNFEGDIS